MDLTFALSAIIFTLLAIVVATSVFSGSSPAAEFANARSYFGAAAAGGLDQSGPRQNGHLPEEKRKKKTAEDWCEISGSSHDHWDVVKSVQSVSSLPLYLYLSYSWHTPWIVVCFVTCCKNSSLLLHKSLLIWLSLPLTVCLHSQIGGGRSAQILYLSVNKAVRNSP